MLPTPTRQESPRSTVNSGHFDDVTAAPAHHVCDIAATPSKCSPRAANASPKASPETPVPSASKRAADAPPTPATEERNTKRQRVPSTKFRAESPSPPPAQRKRVSPNKKSSSSKTPVPSKPTIMPTIFHTDKAALREFRRQNECARPPMLCSRPTRCQHPSYVCGPLGARASPASARGRAAPPPCCLFPRIRRPN